ncbi:hypothetical protein [Cupriavidus basilensis]|uniref:hypothetical protein n=1 Tax=Cupriavidus basilensis TaxID=68895 RepID=UPI0039F65C9D
MATGDKANIYARLRERMPQGWFGTSHPILDAVLNGIASVLAGVFSCYLYLVLQTRLQTSTDGWLDMSAADYFGVGNFPRLPNEIDASYRSRIQINIIRERGTRRAVIKVLTDLTGRAPVLIEPMRPADTGAYGYACGYGVAGAYGSMLMAYQAFVKAFRPVGSGIPNVGGWGASVGGYSTPSQLEWANIGQSLTGVTDAMIYAAVAAVIPAATLAWVSISN